jgi:hypothetical protein
MLGRKRPMLVLGAVLAGLLAVPAAASADERDCVGAIGPETVDNLRVPEGATCTLNGTIVEGTVKVEEGATLDAQEIRVIGNVQAEGADDVSVRDSRVGGSVQVKQGGSGETSGTQVTGDIQYDQQTGELSVSENVVGGSVQVVANTGGIEISSNTIDGNLQCKENEPPPTGGGNLVHGNAEDQCAALAGGEGAPPPGENGEPAPGDDNGSDDDGSVTLRRQARRGARVVLGGRLAGADRGVKVLLQRKRGNRWRSVASDRTNRRGAYRVARKFSRARTVKVRALVRRQTGWSARTVSKVVRIAAR